MKNTAPSANELVQTIRNTLILEWINLQSTAKFSSACIFNESHTVCTGIAIRWSNPILIALFTFFSYPLIDTQYLSSTKLTDDKNSVCHL